MSNDTATRVPEYDAGLSKPFPLIGLLALAMTGFICINTETLPAGLLPQIGEGMGISQSLAGQMVTAYAVGSLLAAIPLTIATRAWRRRTILLMTIAGFLIFNSITALSSNYALTLVARFLRAPPPDSHGACWPVTRGAWYRPHSKDARSQWQWSVHPSHFRSVYRSVPGSERWSDGARRSASCRF